MLSTWYFCCALNTTPEATSAFLCVLDAISSEEDSQLLYIAYEELQRANLWMRAYALPHVLVALNRHKFILKRPNIVQRYFQGLIEGVQNEKQVPALKKLLNSVLAEASPEKIVDDLKVCAKSCQESSEWRHVSEPYLDLKEFLPQTILLSVADACPKSSASVLKDGSSDLRKILDNALDGNLGRLAFQCAIRISHQALIYLPDEIYQKIVNEISQSTVFSPDLLKVCADFWFGSDSSKLVNVKEIFDEFSSTKKLSQLQKQLPFKDKASQQDTVILWQGVLWDLLIQIDPSSASQKLRDIVYSRSVSDNPWRPLQIYRSSGRKKVPKLLYRTPKDKLLKLLITAIASIEILKRLSDSQSLKVEVALLFVAHAWHVLGETKDEYPSMQGLVSFTQRQIKLIGTGQLVVSPRQFTELLDHSSITDYPQAIHEFIDIVFPKVLRSWIYEAYPSATSTSSSKRWLSEVEYVYKAHYDNKDKFIDECNKDFIDKQKIALLTRFLCPDYPIFLSNFGEGLDWRKEKETKAKQWRPTYQKLMLVRDAAPELLAEIDLEEINKSYLPKNVDDDFRLNLVLALERLSALNIPGLSVEVEKYSAWLTDWQNYLFRLNDHNTLERLMRLRLCELLDYPILQEELEAQKIIILIIFEYGCAYDLEKLFRNLYPVDLEGCLVPANELRKDLQKYLLGVMYKALYQSSNSLVDKRKQEGPQDPRITYISYQRLNMVQAIISKLTILSGREYNGHTKGLFKTLLTLEKKKLSRSQSRRQREISCNVEIYQGDQKLIALPEAIDLTDLKISHAIYNPNHSTATLLYDEQLKVNISTEQGEFNVLNLFQLNDVEIDHQLEVGTFSYVRAVLVGIREIDLDRFEYIFNCGLSVYASLSLARKLDWTPGSFYAIPKPYRGKDRGWVVPNPSQGQGHKVEWLGSHSQYQIGDTEKLLLTHLQKSSRDRSSRAFNLRVGKNFFLADQFLNWKSWDADLSKNFREKENADGYSVIAKLNENKQWEPLSHNFTTLLSRSFSNGELTPIVLTFIDEVEGDLGEKAWRCSANSGENYVISPRCFNQNDAAELGEKLKRADLSYGLLITIQVKSFDGCDYPSLLGLVRDREDIIALDSKMNDSYPQLNIPFDERNIEWRNLFGTDDIFLAEKIEDRWWIKVPEPLACQQQQYVEVMLPRMKDSSDKVEIQIKSWKEFEQRSAVVQGLPIPQNQVKRLGGQSWSNVLEDWLEIKDGQHITLNSTYKVSKINRFGCFSCFTNNNFPVQVEAESFTMRPFISNQTVLIDKPRSAVVLKTCWNEMRDVLPQIEDFDEIPEAAIRENVCQGIIVSKPSYQGNRCQVIWQRSDRLETPSNIFIGNYKEIKNFSLGCLIEGTIKESGWHFILKSRYIVASALWSVQNIEKPNNQKFYYLGTINYHDKINKKFVKKTIAELVSESGDDHVSGQCIIFDESSEEMPHLTRCIGNSDRSSDEILNEYPIENIAREIHGRYSFFPKNYRRTMLEQPNGALLTGYCEGDNVGSLLVQQVVITHKSSYSQATGEQFFKLERRFEVIQQLESSINEVDETETELWRQELNDYFQVQPMQELYGRFDDQERRVVKLNSFQVPSKENVSKRTKRVYLLDGENPYVLDAVYPTEVKVCLISYDDQHEKVFASFSQVPDQRPELFQQELEINDGETINLESKKCFLYYVGKVEDQAGTNDLNSKYHRFEWGYGKTLLIEEQSLRFNEEEFSKSRFVLFHGDRIKEIKFYREDRSNVDGYDLIKDEDELQSALIVQINTDTVQPSDGHILVEQAEEYKMIHTLHVKYLPSSTESSDGTIEIEYIESFDESTIKDRRRFNISSASLTDKSYDRLLSQLRQTLGESEGTRVIFGRLDSSHFSNSNTGYRNNELQFEQVRLSFKESEMGEPLKVGERLLLQIDDISTSQNDKFVKLSLPNGFDSSNIDYQTYNALVISRRFFSVREDLLKRITDDTQKMGYSCIKDNFVLVQVGLPPTEEIQGEENIEDRPDQASPKIRVFLSRIPYRKSAALAGAIRSSKRPWFATVASLKDALILELEPGIFIKLSLDEIEAPPQLDLGTIVRVENATHEQGSRFKISEASFGDARYIPEDEVRFAVTLPKDSLFNKSALQEWKSRSPYENRYWQDKKNQFTIGGMPSIQASPRAHDFTQRRWYPAQSSNFCKLMQIPHPKVICVGKYRDNNGRYIFCVDFPSFEVPACQLQLPCKLQLLGDKLAVQVIPIAGYSRESVVNDVQWHLLSFLDQSVEKIIERYKDETWSYHDRTTKTWSEADQEFSIQPLENHSIWSGPLFCEENQTWRLRYRKENFLRYGFPVTELVSSLINSEDGKTYSIAGISDKGGLWIELVPGRIAELPGNLLVWQQLESLSNLHWDSFAPGDLITLYYIGGDPLGFDLIGLKDWHPGSRNAFGSQRCFLPVKPSSVRGELNLGGGSFTLTLPISNANQNWQTVMLTPDNDCQEISRLTSVRRKFEQDDVVLLAWDSNRSCPTVMGFEKERFELYLASDFSEDLSENSLLENIVYLNESTERWQLRFTDFNELLVAIGGSLPVTVEKMSSGNQLFFSMRCQELTATFKSNQLILARIVNLTPDGESAILRCGSQLIKLKVTDIISGLPKDFFELAIVALVQNSQAYIWLYRDENNVIATGIKEKINQELFQQEFLVNAVDILSRTDSPDQDSGIIVRSVHSMKLYWLPSGQASWAKMSEDQLQKTFLSSVKSNFGVRLPWLNEDARISVLQVQEVRSEFNSLSFGRELLVKCLISEPPQQDGSRVYFVESLATKVILRCEVYEQNHDEIAQGIIFPCEVIRRTQKKAQTIIVVPVGKKKLQLDLPRDWVKSGKITSAVALTRRYYLWEEDKTLLPGAVNAETLDQVLCHVYYKTFRDDCVTPAEKLQIEVAKAWIKTNFFKQELMLVYALMAIKLLSQSSEQEIKTREHKVIASMAREMVQNLGRRALRSRHIEVLSKYYVSSAKQSTPFIGFPRLEKVLEHTKYPLLLEDMSAIRQFCSGVGLRSGSEELELQSIAECFSAAIGEVPIGGKVYTNRAEATGILIEISRTLPWSNSASQVSLSELHIQQLNELLDWILQNSPQLMLLDPLEVDGESFFAVNPQEIISYTTIDDLILEEERRLLRIQRLKDLSDAIRSLVPQIGKLEEGFKRLNYLTTEAP
jgi:hypothetical protein